MKYLVTGCSGFIGSNFLDRLLAEGHSVIGVDNLSTGQLRFLDDASHFANFLFIKMDLLDLDGLKEVFSKHEVEMVFHFSANADVRFGTDHPRKDLEQNTIATYNVLEAMRSNGITKIAFSSTGSVYGESPLIPTPEDGPFPIQTSLYGASKAAFEGLISAYCEGFGFQSWIFRFVSILGERYTHGHIFDFYQKLKIDPTRLEVLGNGKQRKSYLYVQDCIDAILIAVEMGDERVNILNLGARKSSTQLNARICEAIQHVTDQIENHGGYGHIDGHSFDHRKIAAFNGQNNFTAHARDAKETLQQKRTQQ